MKIKMIPGEYNAELVEKVKNIKLHSNHEEELEALEAAYGKDALMDALYYACEARDERLADQEAYFRQQLTDEEFAYFVERFLAS